MPHPELDPKSYGFTDADMDRPIYIHNVLGVGDTATLREIMRAAAGSTYCGAIGVEFMHISDPEQKAWIQERHRENRATRPIFTEQAARVRNDPAAPDGGRGFEKFLDVKFVGTKRFGLDGAESADSRPRADHQARRRSSASREIVLGMPHRGRLNVLANVMGKPYVAIFSEFQGGSRSPTTCRARAT